MNLDNIPREMRELNNWVCWKLTSEKNGKPLKKPTKVPYNPLSGYMANHGKPETWVSFADAVQNADKFSGIGFMLGNSPYVGIDIDHCIENGEINENMKDIVRLANSYTEVSPSGTGLHIIVKAELPAGRRGGPFEIYPKDRYLTITGDILPGHGDIVENQTAADAVVEAIDSEKEKSKPPQAAEAVKPVEVHLEHEITVHDLQDGQIFDRIRTSKQAFMFGALFDNGDLSAADGDESAADMALCNILSYWLGPDESRIDGAFRQSALYRQKDKEHLAKWDDKHYANGEAYGHATIRKAIEGRRGRFYDPNYYRKAEIARMQAAERGHETFSPAEYIPLLKFKMTDTGNAERLKVIFGKDLLYCRDSGKWLVWNGKLWEPSEDMEIYHHVTFMARIMANTVEIVYGETVPNTPEDNEKRAMLSFFTKSENQNAIDKIVKRAKGIFLIDSKLLDANKYILNCQNGVIDLNTGKLMPHDRGYLCTRICNAEYRPNVPPLPLWADTVKSIIPDDEERRYLQKWAGYMLTGSCREEKLLFLCGNGRNGKGVFINTIAHILGGYADTINVEVILSSRNDANSGGSGPSAQIAKMVGLRLVTASETGLGRKINDAQIKNLSGRDDITARFMRCNEFTFSPQMKIVVSSNYMPAVNDFSDAMKARLIIAPFNQTFTGAAGDTTLKDRLMEPDNLAAVMRWCVEGAELWIDEGLGEPPQVIKKVLFDYYEDSDVLREFIETACEVYRDTKTPDAYNVTARRFTQMFNTWSSAEGSMRNHMTQSTIKDLMEKRGFGYKKIGPSRCFLGIRFKPEWVTEIV